MRKNVENAKSYLQNNAIVYAVIHAIDGFTLNVQHFHRNSLTFMLKMNMSFGAANTALLLFAIVNL